MVFDALKLIIIQCTKTIYVNYDFNGIPTKKNHLKEIIIGFINCNGYTFYCIIDKL